MRSSAVVCAGLLRVDATPILGVNPPWMPLKFMMSIAAFHVRWPCCCRLRSSYPADSPAVHAARTKGANTIHPAGAPSITAAALCSGAFVSPFVTQKGFTGAAKLYPALTHRAPNATTAAKSIVTR